MLDEPGRRSVRVIFASWDEKRCPQLLPELPASQNGAGRKGFGFRQAHTPDTARLRYPFYIPLFILYIFIITYRRNLS